MNKLFLKLLTFSLLSFIGLMGCAALEDKPVPDPIPYTLDTRTNIDKTKPETFNGNYRVYKYNVNPTQNNILDVLDLQGSFNLYYNSSTQKVTYSYALKYTGYETNTIDFAKQVEYIDIPEYSIDSDKITINFNTPLVINYNNETYTINSIQKVDDNIKPFSTTSTLSDLNIQYQLCDPTIIDTNDSKSCSSVNGALKYIGYYRIETIECGGQSYVGKTDFAGEMTAYPSLASLPQVQIPITIKLQIANTSALKNCFFKSTETNTNNLYYKQDNFILEATDYAAGLPSAFDKVGLIGLTNEDETTRMTQINYLPKNKADYSDLTFGDGNNKVTMRIKLMLQGSAQDTTPVKTLDATPYTNNP